jgi:hypothetical protein
MNVKRYILGSIAVFLFVYVAEFLFHGFFMKDAYLARMDLLRPEAEAMAYMPFMALGFLILAFGFSFIFVQGYEGRGVAEGVRFGLYAAIAFGVSAHLINYAVFPLPKNWVVSWIIGESIIIMLAGAVIALIYKPQTA